MNPSCTQAVEILRELIRFDTTNPPANVKECILFIRKIFEDHGFQTEIIGKEENRPNLITRLKGRGDAPPFLMYGHVDVVAAGHKGWKYPPFEGVLEESCVWGRGALDMKGGIAMMMAALLDASRKGFLPRGDMIFAALCDEESGWDEGAKFLVEEHPGKFDGVQFAIGEFGGFPIYVGNKRFYPIQIAEKQICWMRGKIMGQSGHSAQRMKHTAALKLGRVLSVLGKKRLPVHITPIPEQMITTMAANLPAPMAQYLKLILTPFMTNTLIDLLGERGSLFDPILHNTVNVTILNGGDKINVIPSEITVQMDGRVLPGFSPHDLIAEMKRLTKADMDIEVMRFDPCTCDPDMTCFELLSGILQEQDPECIPIPFLLPAITDARFFSRLGIQTYGFTPMNLPKGFDFTRVIHSENERIPVHCLEFGTKAISRLIERYA